MPGGTIIEQKLLENSPTQGTGDKMLLISPFYGYQVPFNFGSNWTKIKIGMYVSFCRADNLSGLNHGCPGAFDTVENVLGEIDTTPGVNLDAGDATNDVHSYWGIIKNASTKSLPLEVVNEGFIGSVFNTIRADSDSEADYINKFACYVSPASPFSSAVENGSIFEQGGSINDEPISQSIDQHTLTIGCRSDNYISGFSRRMLDNSGQTWSVASASRAGGPDAETFEYNSNILVGLMRGTGTLCYYWGFGFEVVDKGLPTQRVKVSLHADTDSVFNNSLSSDREVSDPSIPKLKDLINGQDVVLPVSYTGAYIYFKEINWSDGSNAFPLPDSFFYYNGFSTLRPRIHAWAVRKIS